MGARSRPSRADRVADELKKSNAQLERELAEERQRRLEAEAALKNMGKVPRK